MAVNDPDSHGISLLYVEDDLDMQEMLSEIIRRRYPDLQLLTAGNGDSGILLFRKFHPEIVITDINMPVSNGIRMAAEIKEMNPSTEIIALSAYTNTAYLLEAIEIGINHYILKPVDIELIFKFLDKALTTIRSERIIARQQEEIRELNTDLAKKAAELEAANQELETFNYTVAHDLRSPMVNISGYSQLLLEMNSSNLDELSKGHLHLIHEEITRINCLIAALLRFSVNSRKPVDKKWTDLSNIAARIITNLRLQEPSRKVTVTIPEGIRAFGDPDLMYIVLDNLLGNAWKYSVKKSNARIEFGSINKEEDIVYFVRDNGIGFDQQEAESLFIPFQRLQCDDVIKGFGIGLTSVQRIIQRHGGRIWAEGKKGKGATFYFTL